MLRSRPEALRARTAAVAAVIMLLGLVTGLAQAQPATAATPVGWQSLSAGATHTCGIRLDETAWCWGDNGDGQVGDPVMTVRTSPVQVGSEKWLSVSAGGAITCGIQVDHTAWCWGNGVFAPTQVGTDGDWQSITVGAGHACGIRTDDSLWCWGANSYGQLGDGTTTSSPGPVEVVGDATWRAVSAGGIFWGTVMESHTCAIQTDGTAWCWGNGLYGQTGTSKPFDSIPHPSPEQVDADSDWLSIEAGGADTCGTRTGGTVWCWGDNRFGQYGDDSTAYGNSPSPGVSGTDWQSLSLGFVHSCGLQTDGTVSCWGSNVFGQLGDGTGPDPDLRLTPLRVGDGSDWVSISAGSVVSCGIRANHTAWCWGDNTVGQLGDGTTTSSAMPVVVRPPDCLPEDAECDGDGSPTGGGGGVPLPTGPDSTNTTRLGGGDRYATAVEISKAAFTPGVPVLHIAAGAGFADGLTAGPAAAKTHGPLLLTPGERLPATVRAEITRLHPGRIVVVGGTSVISQAVVDELNGLAPTSRTAGPDRYATAATIANSWDSAGTVYLVTGLDFADALSGGGLAAAAEAPLLLTQPSHLPGTTRQALHRLAPTRVIIVGGTTVITPAVQAEIETALPGVQVQRLAGADRYQTSALALTSWGAHASVMLASGEAFPDALAGAPAAHQLGAALTLIRPTCTPTQVQQSTGYVVAGYYLLGGATALSDTATTACR